ncbi:MATE family efflux transporter [Pseudonocardia sp. HH130630-07]|uniref:MATE family efflux transporter n=1 Tax=Pseudonocardia sp. HH130630-07 TaxID=1690815 RepID=UPI00081538C4|nr:MATE family efflux transporter [Pseudonocardia sp. HH130630-07]ANY06935.1 hypothetical protein AFB00_12250 [Pseudonocardia sp. HH130630-07]
MTLTRDASPLRELWRLVVPLIVTMFAQVAIVLTDTALVARYSTAALASVALAAPVYLIAVMVVRGWATAAQIVVARRFGSGDVPAVAGATAVALLAGVVTGVVFSGSLILTAGPVLGALSDDPAVVAGSVDYLRIVAVGVPFAAASAVLQAAFAGLGATRIAMVSTLLMIIVNLVLGVTLVFGAGFGVVGAGLSTVVSTVVGTAYLIWFARSRIGSVVPGAVLLARGDLARGRVAVPVLARLAWPEAALLFFGYLNEVLVVGFAAQVGSVDLAAYRLLDNLTLVIYNLLAAVGAGIAILAGQCLGAGDVAAVRTYQRTGVVLALVLATPPAVLAALFPGTLFSLATADTAVVDLAASTAPLAVVTLVPIVLSLNIAGVLRASGDNVTVMIASLVADYAVLVPLAWFLGLVLGWGLTGIYVAWLGFGLTMLAITGWRYATGRWRTQIV